MTSDFGVDPGDREDLAERVWEAFDRPVGHPATIREEAAMGTAYFHCLSQVQRCAELLARGEVDGLRDAAHLLSAVADELAVSGIPELDEGPEPDGRRVAAVAAYWGDGPRGLASAGGAPPRPKAAVGTGLGVAGAVNER